MQIKQRLPEALRSHYITETNNTKMNSKNIPIEYPLLRMPWGACMSRSSLRNPPGGPIGPPLGPFSPPLSLQNRGRIK